MGDAETKGVKRRSTRRLAYTAPMPPALPSRFRCVDRVTFGARSGLRVRRAGQS